MPTVNITIQKTTYDALQRLMRPALDDSVDDVIVSLLRNLERRQMREGAARSNGAAEDHGSQRPDDHSNKAPGAGPGARSEAESRHAAEAPSGAGQGNDDIPAQATHADNPADRKCPSDGGPFRNEGPVNHPEPSLRVMEMFSLGPNEVMYSDLLNEFGYPDRARYHSGMKIIVSPDHAEDVKLFTRTKPCVIRFSRQVNDQQERVIINVNEWKAAALEVAQRAKGISVVKQAVVFEAGSETGRPFLHDELSVGASKGITVRNVGLMQYIADPESSVIDTNGMTAPRLLWLIIAIIQKDPQTRLSNIVIEFEWKNSERALFSGESGILKLPAQPDEIVA